MAPSGPLKDCQLAGEGRSAGSNEMMVSSQEIKSSLSNQIGHACMHGVIVNILSAEAVAGRGITECITRDGMLSFKCILYRSYIDQHTSARPVSCHLSDAVTSLIS